MNTSNLLKSFEAEIRRKGFREATVSNYLSCVTAFLSFFKDRDSAKHVSETDIKSYLSRFKTHNTQRANHSAIKCFYLYACRQPNKFKYIEYCKRDRKIPLVLSQEEVQRIFSACSNLKHKAIMCLLYSAGLRVGEVIKLRVRDIDSSRMVINVIDAKGGKDRQVMLDQSVLSLLRDYYKQYRPSEYLFNGQFGPQYSERSINQFLKHYANAAGIKKRVYAHLFRHTSFTHLVEAGTDINLIQRLAGHSSVKTTALYTHISHSLISKIKSPITTIDIWK